LAEVHLMATDKATPPQPHALLESRRSVLVQSRHDCFVSHARELLTNPGADSRFAFPIWAPALSCLAKIHALLFCVYLGSPDNPVNTVQIQDLYGKHHPSRGNHVGRKQANGHSVL
jgi:hypothetical protein